MSWPSGLARLSVTDFLFRLVPSRMGDSRVSRPSLSFRTGGPTLRGWSPASGRSTSRTSAPTSPSIWAGGGPASTRERSSTRMPERGSEDIVWTLFPALDARGGNHLGPLFLLAMQERGVAGGRQCHRRESQLLQLGAHGGLFERDVESRVQAVDDRCRRAGGDVDPDEGAGEVVGITLFGHRGHRRQGFGPRRWPYRQRAHLAGSDERAGLLHRQQANAYLAAEHVGDHIAFALVRHMQEAGAGNMPEQLHPQVGGAANARGHIADGPGPRLGG